MSTDNILIEIKNLNFKYPKQEDSGENSIARLVLYDINLCIEKKEIVVLIGASGCGKTTLCRCITGIIPRLIKGDITGTISSYDKEITNVKEIGFGELSGYMGFVMQEPDHQIVMSTVEDDIAFGPENMMRDPQIIREAVDRTAAQVNLEDKKLRTPTKLSGGEKQRLAIGGALVMESQILIFDEPMSNLDNIEKVRFIEHIKKLREEGKTILIVEHDYEQLDFADKWVLMKNGRIIFQGAPENVDVNILEQELWQ